MTNTQKEKIKHLKSVYELTGDDFYNHYSKQGQHQYTIINRRGIEKIQAIEEINIEYEVIECTANFAALKGKYTKNGVTFETFASATKGANYKDGNTQSWYVLEIAEKRALSRCVLRAIDLYKHGFFAEDESEEFKKENS